MDSFHSSTNTLNVQQICNLESKRTKLLTTINTEQVRKENIRNKLQNKLIKKGLTPSFIMFT